MKRSISEEETEANKRLIKWLSTKQQELGFTQKELAQAIGVNRKTVSLYLSGESIIKKETELKITEYIKSLKRSGRYLWRRPEKFGDILQNTLANLHLDQQWLAEQLGTDQRTISGYINGDKKTNAHEQFDILKCLYDAAKLEYGTPEEVSAAASKLEQFLFGRKGEFGQNDESFYYEDAVCHTDLLEYFEGLSPRVQEQILTHCKAFFEQTEKQLEYGVTVILSTYDKRARLMSAFREMTDDERSQLVYDYEQNALMTFPRPDDNEEVSYFGAVADMRTLVTCDEYYEALGADKGASRTSQKDKNRYLFEQLICRHGIMPEALDELKMKLTFTKYEWYVWSLILIFFHNDEGDFE